jgi:hypothetical protein
MPQSWKCAECGLVNFASEANCKRCRVLNPQVAIQPDAPAGIVLEDGYVLPPPPNTGGVWRDSDTLVMTKDALLPDRCVKCNAPAYGFRLKRNLSWHHPALALLIFVALLIYIVVALAVSKRATVHLGVCAEHMQRRRNLLIVGWALLAIGLITPVIAFRNEYVGIGLLGIALVMVAAVWLVLVARVVKVKRIDDRYVWLKGIDPNYLAQFPSLSGVV